MILFKSPFFRNKLANNPRQRGAAMEQRAAHYLQQQGLVERQRNYRCRRGEIDLVMQAGPTLVFVEVRFRRHTQFGNALESIDWRKQQRIRCAAEYYLAQHDWSGPCRFDAVGIDGAGQIQWVADAF